eukprot:4289922-Pyramimonas_sp.AAC.1
MTPKRGQIVIRVGNRNVQVQYSDARHSLYIEALIAREIGSDNVVLRTALTFVASLSSGRPALTFGYVPAKKGALQRATASRLSPKVHLALQHVIRNFSRIENVVSVRLAKRTHKLPPVTYADNCTLVHYDIDVNPGLHHDEAEGIVLNIHGIVGSAHSRITQCLKSTQPQAGFDQDMSEFEELADTPTPDGTAREASAAEPSHDGGRLSTIYAESEADLESQ